MPLNGRAGNGGTFMADTNADSTSRTSGDYTQPFWNLSA